MDFTIEASTDKDSAGVTKQPSFFISKKVQVEWPELDSWGNAQAFIVIFKYGKLEIGLRRDFRDFVIFLSTASIYRERTWDL